jgi:hypothetical protein
MKKLILAALASAGLVAATSPVQAQRPASPFGVEDSYGRYDQFDVRNARTWAERLVICDTTAFLATHPNLDASRMWARRDDGRRDLLLPPYFIGAGRWYKQGYEQLYWRLRRERQVTRDEIYRAQDTIGRRFVDIYRRSNGSYGGGGGPESRFLDRQDAYCRAMASQQGFIVS